MHARFFRPLGRKIFLLGNLFCTLVSNFVFNIIKTIIFTLLFTLFYEMITVKKAINAAESTKHKNLKNSLHKKKRVKKKSLHKQSSSGRETDDELPYYTQKVLSFMQSSTYGRVQITPYFKFIESKSKTTKHKFSILFNTESAYLENLPLQEGLQNSDWKANNQETTLIFYSALNCSYEVNVDNDLFFHTSLYKTGYLGNEQLAHGATQNTSYLDSLGANPVYFESVYFLWKINQTISVQVGRSYFELSHTKATDKVIKEREYLFADTIEGIVFNVSAKSAGVINILLFDVFTSRGYNKSEYLQSTAISNQENNFKGDTTSFRAGLSFTSNWYRLSKKPGERWNFQPFFYFLRYGAVKGGIERSLNGLGGNFTDNDYLLMYGIKSALEFNLFDVSIQAAGSDGIDRKIVGYPDYDNDILSRGIFLSLSIYFHSIGIGEGNQLFLLSRVTFSEGPSYDKLGKKINYGFTSQQSQSSGGLILGKFSRYKPTNQTGYEGVKSNYIGATESGGNIQIYLNATLMNAKQVRFIWENWYYHDHSNIHKGYNEENRTNDYHNKPIGWESNFTIFYPAKKNLFFYSKVGILLPLEYFESQYYDGMPKTSMALQFGSTFIY